MKRTILLAAIALMVSMSAGVVGYDGPKDQPHIMRSSGSSATGSAAVGPNGTEWRSSVKMRGRNSDTSIGEKVENVSFSENKTSFSGYIQAPTPCHVIDQETSETEDGYQINIETVKENQSQICTQQIVMIRYDASFESETPYDLTVKHNNQTVETLENTVENDTTQKNNKGILKGLFSWLGNLF